jgi:hypothetical protein
MNRTDAVLASIDGALADEELPDAMRWSPQPEKVTDAGWATFDGDCVPLPPQRYEPALPVIPARLSAGRPRFLTFEESQAAGPYVPAEPPPDQWISPLAGPRVSISPPLSQHASGLAVEWVPVGTTDWRPEPYQPSAEQLARLRELAAQVTSPELLLVQETGPGSVRVSRLGRTQPLTAEEAAAIIATFGQVFERVIESLVPVFRTLGEAWADLVERFAGLGPHLGPLVEPAPPSSPEEIRVRALDLARTRHAGPPRPGPERSHAPRRLAR